MSATASLQKKWNQLCDVIWDDPEAKQDEGTAGKEAGDQAKKKTRQASNALPEDQKTGHRFINAHRFELAFVFVMGALLFFLAWILPLNGGPGRGNALSDSAVHLPARDAAARRGSGDPK